MQRLRWFVLAVGMLCAATAQAAEKRPLMSVSYTASGIKQEAEMIKGISEERVRADLKALAPYTARVRTYSVERGLENVPKIAKEFGLKVTMGIWLDKDPAKNIAEVEKGIRIASAYPDVVDRVLVGNEALMRENLSVADAIKHINRVKSALAKHGTQVSTGEPWYIWEKNPELAKAADFIGAHILVYWDGVAAKDAADYFALRYDTLQRAFPKKHIMIAETGWPTGGAVRQGSIPSAENQVTVVRAFLRQAAQRKYDYNIVDAYDQPWKARDEGAVGAFWGIFSDAGKPKFDFTVAQAP